ncbi:MAG TPA: DUF2891 domain-containing protein [Bacteroidales bacterium]|nr:DUF2891 domain-containing protein [Bacteroidales bacterium]
MKNPVLVYIIILLLSACQTNRKEERGHDLASLSSSRPVLDINEANRLADLPISCIEKEYPNKLNQTITGDEDLLPPRDLHPSFCGCFDWHSSVHGHWSVVMLMKKFPGLEKYEEMKSLLSKSLDTDNIQKEIEYFSKDHNRTFERTYGWAWLLKLAEELYTWDSAFGREMYNNISPLAGLISEMYIEFLPRLHYPIRVGTHTNTAFGLCFAYDYAASTDNDSLLIAIKNKAREFYFYDTECPVSWEPGGNDFLSPCLEEADIMRRVLDAEEFEVWLKSFLPDLSDPSYIMEPGVVSDRTDSQLAHLDGLNFSRAWCLYGIANSLNDYQHLAKMANEHINYSLPDIADGNYEGGHWLASFALLALDSQ